MGIKIDQNTLRLRNEATGEIQSVAMFGSGADRTLSEIAEYADGKKIKVEDKNSDIQQMIKRLCGIAINVLLALPFTAALLLTPVVALLDN